DPAFQLGSENTQFWGPMGTAIISGLTFSTFLTLVIVPVMYSTFDSIAARFGTSSDEATDTALHTDGALVPAPAGLRPTEGDGAGNGTVVRPTPSTS
ncbi:MAG: hypothetical protein AAFN13_10210, partial [Bacteroidota bacterium]